MAGAAGVASALQGCSSGPRPYVGYLSLRGDDRIAIFAMDPDTAAVRWTGEVAAEGGPGPMAIDRTRRFLYVALRNSRRLNGYEVDASSGSLTLVSSEAIDGEPVCLESDRSGRYLLSALFYQSAVAVHAVDSGIVEAAPRDWRVTAYGPHGMHADPTNQLVVVPHVARSGGPNAVAQFRFDEGTGRLTPSDPPFHYLREYIGPRHMAFHPTLNVVYSSDEQGSSATAYRIDRASGTISDFQSVSTVPSDYVAASEITCSQLKVSPSGRFLFVMTRGHDSIASFSIDPSTGSLTPADRVPAEPDARPLCIDPRGRFLLAAGGGMADFGRLATYRVDEDTGRMTPLERYDAGNGPMWIIVTELEP